MKRKLFLTLLLYFLTTNCFAETWAFLLANDTPEAHRKKEGDIVAVRAANWQWGRKERQQYLIVLVDTADAFTNINEARKFETPIFADGRLTPIAAEGAHLPNITAKNRYKITFSDIDRLANEQGIVIDWDKVKNEAIDYQPLLDQNIVFSHQDLIHCKFSKRKLKAKDLGIIKNAGKKGAKNKLD